MATTLTSKGQVTIPKAIRDALNLQPGSAVEFSVNREGEVVLNRIDAPRASALRKDRFAAVRGKATVKWRTDDLMRMLRE